MPIPLPLEATGAIQGDGTTITIRGSSVVRTGTGTYEVTLDQEIDDLEMYADINPKVGAARAYSVRSISDSVKEITFRSNTNAFIDTDFIFRIFRIIQL